LILFDFRSICLRVHVVLLLCVCFCLYVVCLRFGIIGLRFFSLP